MIHKLSCDAQDLCRAETASLTSRQRTRVPREPARPLMALYSIVKGQDAVIDGRFHRSRLD
jgi:hypothetical protein